MNKKILAGFLSAAAVGSFWACGSGEINEPDPMTDGIVELQYMPNGVPDVDKIQSMINEAKDSCAAHAASCGSVYAAYLQEGAKPNQTAPVSSSTGVQEGVGLSSDAIASISSSSRTISYSAPSSSTTIIDDPETPASSASGATEVTGLGKCTAVAADGRTPVTEIAKGVPVKFKVTPGTVAGYDPMDFMTGVYTWSFGANAIDDGSANGTASGLVTFSASGPITPKVHVIIGDGAKKQFVEGDIDCEPRNVNGAPITGCVCEGPATVDIAEDAVATWTVSGCVSEGAEVNEFVWPTGMTPSADGLSGSYTFTAAKEYAPEVVAKSTDFTEIKVPCKSPVVSDKNNPETNISISYSDTRTKLEAGSTYTITYTDNRGSLVCFGSGTVTCGAGDAVEVGAYGVKVGDFSECVTVVVSKDANIECANTW